MLVPLGTYETASVRVRASGGWTPILLPAGIAATFEGYGMLARRCADLAPLAFDRVTPRVE